jgi:uncharacterized protein YoxC
MTLLTVFVGIIALCNLLVLVSISILAIVLARAVNTSVIPVVKEFQTTMKDLNKTLQRIESRADTLMDVGEDTIRKVSLKVVATSDLVEQNVVKPVITVSSIAAGVSKAWETWKKASAA